MARRATGGVALAALAMGCMTRGIAPRDVGSTGQGADLDIHLVDSTSLRMDQARAVEASICGRMRACDGPSCAAARVVGCVAKENIASISAREIDQQALAASVIGGGALVLLAAGAVAVSTSTGGRSSGSGSSSSGSLGSCPRIYSWDGAGWRLDSGTFGLSYFEAAPRTDFDRLDHLVADHGHYRLRLVNEQDETEHTDLVRLRVIDHPAGTRVVPAASGKLVTFRDEAPPLAARDLRGRDALELVSRKDDHEWTSDLHDRHWARAEDARDGLRLVFAKPRDATTARLRLAAHTTDWAGKMLGYLLAHRGPTLSDWWARMNTDARARAELDAFLIREGMLGIRVKTPDGWKTRGVFWAAGSEIVKEEAFELAIADVPGETVEVELESALDFWSVDSATIAFGDDEPIVLHDVAPSSARTNQGRDISSLLARVDAQRFDTVRGDIAELSFPVPAPAPAGTVRSFVVETNGYYVPHIAPAADADPAAMDALVGEPYAASRLALAFRVATAWP